MANEIFRSRIKTTIEFTLKVAKDAGLLKHDGMKGRLREVVISELIEPLLPNGVQVATGSVIDSKGGESSQLDAIIYSTSLLPPFMKLKEQVIVPVEACIQVIEIKSKLTATEMSDAIKKAQSVKKLDIQFPQPSDFEQYLTPYSLEKIKAPAIFSVFAFDTDLKVKDEISRFKERVPSALANHVLINDICVAKKGYWHKDHSTAGWGFQTATEEFDEVIMMLAKLADSIPNWIKYRGMPNFSHYIL